MRSSWLQLNLREQDIFRAAVVFLENRLCDSKTIEWALVKATHSKVLRVAVVHSLSSTSGRSIKEPWQSAWRYIEEYWREPTSDMPDGTGEYDIQNRLAAGELSGSLVQDLVNLVAPRLQIESHSRFSFGPASKKRLPKQPSDLFSMGITSGKAIDLDVLKLSKVTSPSFLFSLCTALEAAVARGLEIAKRAGWEGGPETWRLGQLNRVYTVPRVSENAGRGNEPDQFHQGIAPSVKLLYATTERLIAVNIAAGLEIVQGWRLSTSPVFLRLWAALARNPFIVPPEEVAGFFSTLSDDIFWLTSYYPEVAELRARRFKDLSADEQASLTGRISKMPPRRIWPHVPAGEGFKKEQTLTAVQELLRIEAAGGRLDEIANKWLASKKLSATKVGAEVGVEAGFPSSEEAHWVQPDPDLRFDTLDGETRLDALAEALAAPRLSWEMDPAERAADWLRQPQSIERIILDLERTKSTRRGAAQLWERVGWAHTPQNFGGNPDLGKEANRILVLLEDLPEEIVERAIEGISHWLSSWERQVVSSKLGRTVWTRIWPLAVKMTNVNRSMVDQFDLNATGKSTDDRRPMDLDTLNTPAGKLIGVFLAGCPNLKRRKRPFAAGSPLRSMRDLIMRSTGRAKLIALHRMTEALAYFLQADRRWTIHTLIPPLLQQTGESKVLWRSLARRIQFKDVVKELGAAMLKRSTDVAFDREIRQMLAIDLVIECLQANLEKRKAVIELDAVQQMLRSVEDEVRANVAGVLTRFIYDTSSPKNSAHSPHGVFQLAVAPFLQVVWPQEASLSTAGVSKAFAVLPAATNEAFAEAVGAVSRFLVPFDAWSMSDYGLDGEKDGAQKIIIVNDSNKARALLLLLDRTIGAGERAMVPHDLGLALSHIRNLSPELGDSSSFRRLAALARR